MVTLIFLGIIINLLPLYRPPYFVFCSYNYFCVFLCTRANIIRAARTDAQICDVVTETTVTNTVRYLEF
jgi:hypothetical protein